MKSNLKSWDVSITVKTVRVRAVDQDEAIAAAWSKVTDSPSTRTKARAELAKIPTINAKERLYVLPSGDGWSCLGFDVAENYIQTVRKWRELLPSTIKPGTTEHLAEYREQMREGAGYAKVSGKRCDADLTPRLIGLEGKRIEVTDKGGERRRFWVGKSTGWMPCHLEIMTRRSIGGVSVYLPDSSTFRIIEDGPRGR